MQGPPQRFEFHSAAPSARLAPFVECIWAVRGIAPYRRASVLPNGALQLMVNLGAPHRVIGIGASRTDRSYRDAWIAGLQDAPLAIESPPATDLVAIRFRPGGAHAFLPLPVVELTNAVQDADAVLGSALHELREQLALATTRIAQVQAAERWLLARFRPREHDHRLLARATAALNAPRAGERTASVAHVCEQLGLSNRHLVHLFQRDVGLAPKTYARVQRFHAALERLPRAASRADLALELGYADQAHFNNEFRRFAGVSPGTFIARRGEDDESLILG